MLAALGPRQHLGHRRAEEEELVDATGSQQRQHVPDQPLLLDVHHQQAAPVGVEPLREVRPRLERVVGDDESSAVGPHVQLDALIRRRRGHRVEAVATVRDRDHVRSRYILRL